MTAFNYDWGKDKISYTDAKKYILDLGFTDQSPTVQMRRAYFALLGICTGMRTQFCGTQAHKNRIFKALDLIKERRLKESKSKNLGVILKEYKKLDRGKIEYSDTSDRVGSLVKNVRKMIVVGSKEVEKVDLTDIQKLVDNIEKVNRSNKSFYDYHQTVRKYQDNKRYLELHGENTPDWNKQVEMHKRLDPTNKFKRIDKLFSAQKKNQDSMKEHKEKMENYNMGIEDKLSKIVESRTKKVTIFQEKLYDRWFHKPWIVKTKKLTLDEMAKKSFIHGLNISNSKYMNYFRYNHMISQYQTMEINENKSTTSKTKSRSRALSIKRQTYPHLDWSQLDDFLYKQENWDETSEMYVESVLEKAALTDSMLKDRKKMDDGWRGLANSDYLTPTFFRRFCKDFVYFNFTNTSFDVWRSLRLKEIEDLNNRKRERIRWY